MAEMNLFGAGSGELITLMNATTATGFSVTDAGGEAAVTALMEQAETWILEALPDESVRLLGEIDDEILCRAAQGTETDFVLGGLGGIRWIDTDSVRVFRLAATEAESFFNAARTMSRQQFVVAIRKWELTAGEAFAVEQDGETHLTLVRLGDGASPAEADCAFVAAYTIPIDATFVETGLQRLLLARTAADVARRLGLDEEFKRFDEEARTLLKSYARFERLPWSRKKLDLVRDRTVRADAARNRLAVGRCVRG